MEIYKPTKNPVPTWSILWLMLGCAWWWRNQQRITFFSTKWRAKGRQKIGCWAPTRIDPRKSTCHLKRDHVKKEMKHLPTIKWFKDLVSTLHRSLYRYLGGRLTFWWRSDYLVPRCSMLFCSVGLGGGVQVSRLLKIRFGWGCFRGGL